MMDKWDSLDDVLDFAISEEEAAAEFYADLAKQMERPGMREVFATFAREEIGHKKKLQAVKAGGEGFEPVENGITDLKIAEYVIDIEPTADMAYEQALVTAMKKEKAAFKLYSDLALATTAPNIRNTFLALAQEEARHKLRFEVEYDDLLQDN